MIDVLPNTQKKHAKHTAYTAEDRRIAHMESISFFSPWNQSQQLSLRYDRF